MSVMQVGSVGLGKISRMCLGAGMPPEAKYTLVALWEQGLTTPAMVAGGGMHNDSNRILMRCKNPNVPLTDENMVE